MSIVKLLRNILVCALLQRHFHPPPRKPITVLTCGMHSPQLQSIPLGLPLLAAPKTDWPSYTIQSLSSFRIYFTFSNHFTCDQLQSNHTQTRHTHMPPRWCTSHQCTKSPHSFSAHIKQHAGHSTPTSMQQRAANYSAAISRHERFIYFRNAFHCARTPYFTAHLQRNSFLQDD